MMNRSFRKVVPMRHAATKVVFLFFILATPAVWAQQENDSKSLSKLAIDGDTDPQVLVDTAFALRCDAFLESLNPSYREHIETLFDQHPRFARLLLFSIQPEDKPGGMVELLMSIEQARLAAFKTHPNLVAAIVLVHDEPMTLEIVENKVKSPDPVSILDYFIQNHKRLTIDPNSLPPRLLVWVVDTTASIEEMQWALKRHGKDRLIGKTYFDLEYDYRHLRRGVPKKVTQAGYTLPNLKRYGGVCADQAYYATMIGKAIGVPTAIAKGERAQIFHAWTGFLQVDARRVSWNFSEGRYPAYRSMRGAVLDPQTRETVPDSIVSLSANLYRLDDAQRWQCEARCDALEHLIEDKATPVAEKIALFDRILDDNPFHIDAWLAIVALAETGQMSPKEKMQVAKELMRVSGQRYPDFTMLILKPIIATFEDAQEQEKLWAEAYKLFAHRKELAAEVLMARAAAWSARGEKKKATLLYEDVIKRYANDGPFVIEALEHTEQSLIDLGKPDVVPRLYRQTLDRIDTPGNYAPDFRKLSNWYRVAVLYKQKLEAAGDDRQAAKLQKRIDQVIDK